MKERFLRAVTGLVLDRTLRYIDKDPQKNIIKLADKAEMLSGNMFPKKFFDSVRSALNDPDNVWSKFALSIISNTLADLRGRSCG